jgi:glucose-1-phosphate adenylyltransferase
MSIQPEVASPEEAPRRASLGTQLVASGCPAGAVVGFDCRIDHDAVVEDSVLFDSVCVGRRVEVRRAILDKAVRVCPGRVGLDHEEDRQRGFVISEGGITCVPRGAVVAGDN